MNNDLKKKTARQRNLDKLAVAKAEAETAAAAADLVDHLLGCEMDPAWVPIKLYNELIDQVTGLKNRLAQQKCEYVAERWPKDADGEFIFDDITLEGAYK